MEMERLLVIVDPQVDFTTGSLKVQGGKEAMDRLAEFLCKTKMDFKTVVMTRDWHPEDHCSFLECGGQFPKHCVKDTPGAEYYPAVLKAVVEYCMSHGAPIDNLTKGTHTEVEEYSGFASAGNASVLESCLTMEGIEEIWIAGLATDYCVYNTLVDILECCDWMKHKVKVKVMKDCISAVDPSDTKMDRLVGTDDRVEYTNALEIC